MAGWQNLVRFGVTWLITCCHVTLGELHDAFPVGDSQLNQTMHTYPEPTLVFGVLQEEFFFASLENAVMMSEGSQVHGFIADSLDEIPIDRKYSRLSTDVQDLDHGTEIVRAHFGYHQFTAGFVIIGSFVNFSRPRDNGTEVNGLSQMAVIVGGNMTFVMFQYENIEWCEPNRYSAIATIHGSLPLPLVPVFEAGEDELALTYLQHGNTGVTARWLVRIDMCDNCFVLPRDSGFCYKLKCHCFRGYTGPLCEFSTNNECEINLADQDNFCLIEDIVPDPCGSYPCVHGDCSSGKYNYSCSCDLGYEGDNCEVNIDDCEGRTCSGRGVCLDDLNDYRCECYPGFSGNNCDYIADPCLSNPCAFGSCLVTGNEEFSCACEAGYEGILCKMDVDDCVNVTCSNKGVCLDEINDYTCQCHPGYKGNDCQLLANACLYNPCYYGSCYLAVPGSYQCACTPGYTGRDCEAEVNECASSPCNQGTCLDAVNEFTCACYPGFEGEFCNQNIDDCVGVSCVFGYCQDSLEHAFCVCGPGYTGEDCSANINECSSNPCISGTCVDMPNHYECQCAAGMTGTHCEVDIDECASAPCFNGDCVDGINSFTCQRCSGFDGTLCETQLDHCVSSPCGRHGTCRSVIRGYVCDCIDDVIGINCEQDNRIPIGTFDSWQQWSDSSCSKSCDTGLIRRYRQCLRPPCLQPNSESRTCQILPCPGSFTEEAHSVLLISTKSILEVVRNELILREAVANRVNSYCASSPVVCCDTVARGFSVTAFRPILTSAHVRIISGYPKSEGIGKISIRLAVDVPQDVFMSACGVRTQSGVMHMFSPATSKNPKEGILNPDSSSRGDDPGKTSKRPDSEKLISPVGVDKHVGKDDSTTPNIGSEVRPREARAVSQMYLPQHVLQDAIDTNPDIFSDNPDLCCISAGVHETRSENMYLGVVLGTAIPACIIILLLLIVVTCIYITHRRKTAETAMAANTAHNRLVTASNPNYYLPPRSAPQAYLYAVDQ